MPEAISPVKTIRVGKEEPIEVLGVKIPRGIFRQTTGLTSKTKTLVQREIDELTLHPRTVYPQTGVPKADRQLSKYMAPLVEQLGPNLINSPGYKKLSRAGKRIAMAEMFREIRAFARRRLNKDHPDLSILVAHKGMSQDIKTLMEEQNLGITIK